MSQTHLEQRVTQLEQQVAQILQHQSETSPLRDAWKKTIGMFRGDPVFQQMLEETARCRKMEREEARRDAC